MSNYLVYRQSLKNGDIEKPLKKRKPIKPISDKRKVENIDYLKAREKYLAVHKVCEAKLLGCKIGANQIHHKAGRIGELLTDESNFLAVCNSCHSLIELNPEMAKEKGFSNSRLRK